MIDEVSAQMCLLITKLKVREIFGNPGPTSPLPFIISQTLIIAPRSNSRSNHSRLISTSLIERPGFLLDSCSHENSQKLGTLQIFWGFYLLCAYLACFATGRTAMHLFFNFLPNFMRCASLRDLI